MYRQVPYINRYEESYLTALSLHRADEGGETGRGQGDGLSD